MAASTGTFYGRAMTAGDIYTIAGNGADGFSGDGGPATSAEVNGPQGVAADAAGNLLIADTDNTRVRVVAASTGTFYGRAMTAGDIYTVAGNGRTGSPGTAARPPAPRSTARRAWRGRQREPADRRHEQQPDPGGGERAPAPSTARR